MLSRSQYFHEQLSSYTFAYPILLLSVVNQCSETELVKDNMLGKF
jgi:hypothetical protein